MQHIYLDRRVWIELGKAAKGRTDGDRFADALAVIRYAAEHHLALFPLCPTTYLEQQGTDNARRRHEVGDLMGNISGGLIMASPGEDLVHYEVDLALQKRFGRPIDPRPFQPFGKGIEFAFGVDVEEHITVFDEEPWCNLEPTAIDQLKKAIAENFETYALRGPGPGEKDLRGPRTYRKHAEQWVEDEKDQAERFRNGRADADMQRRTLLARESIRLMPDVWEACVRAQIDPKLVYRDADTVTTFLYDLPVISSQVEMIRMQHRNRQRGWKVTDFYDLMAFSVAVVYCDTLVIEKHWAALMRRAKLDERFCTLILNDVQEIPQHLVAA